MLKTDITVCLKTIYLWSWVQICSADKYGGGWICGYMCEVGCICGCMCGGSCIFGCMCGGSYICGFVEVVVFVATSVKEVAFGYMCGGRSICGYRCEGGCIYGYKCGVCCICGQVKKKQSVDDPPPQSWVWIAAKTNLREVEMHWSFQAVVCVWQSSACWSWMYLAKSRRNSKLL